MNRPQNDEALIREAGIKLDRALFPPLVLIERLGPIGVVDLAERVGRDYTTVSRQVARLESLGLVRRQPQPGDRRVRESVITDEGRVMTDMLDAARFRMAEQVFEDWDRKDFDDLVRLMRRFTDAIEARVGSDSADGALADEIDEGT
ncbi:MarR family winged helix-turn-helix transcriptional regulator [Luteibacter aegosomatissinici]|uniref:MarR family winged helix-turn-helix transcriptional regulator n=1 Tax=Luteibacter aegosomatissinici TaxID=2911539 RepID=UPI001FF84B56|nr:MarR family transcriptional regulator [Luteibacter aegosomatissinici]UPG96752.1 MarR family transcriptional regulator [Luteibacter aegosomatissinici]